VSGPRCSRACRRSGLSASQDRPPCPIDAPWAIPEPLTQIRDALREDQALPALGQSVAMVTKMASGESDTVEQLAQAILADASLTQRLLRLANSPLYRTRDAAPVTTVSRALVLLGFDQIRTLALSMMLMDRLVENAQSRSVMRDFGQALGASAVARCTLQRRWPACAEEGAIGAMFRNVGRLIAAIHVPDAVSAVRAETGDGTTEAAAARRIIGRNFEELALEVVGSWGLPVRIEHALQPCATRPLPPRSSLDWVQVASAFGDDAGRLERRHGPQARERTVSALHRRFGDALDMDNEAIVEVLEQARRDTEKLAQGLGLAAMLGEAPAADMAAALAGASLGEGDAGDPEGGRSTLIAPRGDAPAEQRLLTSVSKVSQALAESRGIGRGVQVAAEVLREVLGATRVVYLARDDAAAAYRPRAAAGCVLADLRARVAMPVQFAPDLFHAALARGADLHIADIGAESVRGRLPAWQTLAFPKARGFLVLPVMVDGRPMGFFYADREVANAPPPDASQAEAIRLLRSQIVLALRTEPAAR
jgi:HD-like signal output (HDOD) protein